MKNKKLLSILFVTIIFLIGIGSLTSACFSSTSKYTSGFKIDINMDNLNEYCENSECFIKEDNILLKSKYDPKVLIIIGKVERSALGFEGVGIILPYYIDKTTHEIHYNYVSPQDYNLEECAKKDLDFLKEIGVVSLTGEEIIQLSKIAEFGNIVQKCRREWYSWPDNYVCSEQGEGAFGDGLYNIVKCSAGNLDFSEFIEGEKSYLIYYIIGGIILIIILFLIILKKK